MKTRLLHIMGALMEQDMAQLAGKRECVAHHKQIRLPEAAPHNVANRVGPSWSCRLCRFLLGLWVLFAFAGAGQASAHQQNIGMTFYRLAAKAQAIEVAHRFYLHDAAYIYRSALKDGIFADNIALRRKFARAIHAHSDIALVDAQGEKTLLREALLIGTEIRYPFIWVYARIPYKSDNLPPSVEITSSALMDIWPNQVNLVTIEDSGHIQSAYFSKGKETQLLSLAPKH